MQVILIQDVDNLGAANELVTVKNGYARNYLIPAKFAVEANAANTKQLNERMKVRAKKEAAMLAEINKVVSVLKESPLKIGAKTGTSGKIFGSVTALQIARAIRDQKGTKSTGNASLLQTKLRNWVLTKPTLTLVIVTILKWNLK